MPMRLRSGSLVCFVNAAYNLALAKLLARTSFPIPTTADGTVTINTSRPWCSCMVAQLGSAEARTSLLSDVDVATR
ncbi:hypothetical protein BD289DRAFT_139714 [Coniella lustricola]|uniref:Secreted protein n=1 Tax=Coniella lustricola TaxID=2025994 RepID=A0A2T3AF66_9PEZI|nr:hypothetical protein BD289DRAFT_139714 [Coniella lustricola]